MTALEKEIEKILEKELDAMNTEQRDGSLYPQVIGKAKTVKTLASFIEDRERKAFEAGRERFSNTDETFETFGKHFLNKYTDYDSYKNKVVK